MGFTHKARGVLALSASGLALLGATPAWAQADAVTQPTQQDQTPSSNDEAAPDAPVNETEIVVTAQKRQQNLIDVPASVQAVTGETLERTGRQNLTDLVNLIPGASVVSRSAPGFETIQIRGISSGTVGDTTTGYYIDDVVFSIPNLQISPPARLFDLERTEILRGPQGTLYGNGAMGGLIRLITAQPSTTDSEVRGQGELSFTDGGGTNYATDAVVNVPIARDVAGLRLSGGYERLSGFGEARDRPGEKNLNPSRSWNVRGKLLLRPTSDITTVLSVWHIKNSQDYNNGFVSVDPPILPNVHGTDPFNRVTATFYSGSVNWDLGPVSLQSGTSYLKHRLSFDTTFNTPALDLRAVADFRSRSFSQEVRLVSDASGPFDWIVGGLYTDAKIRSGFDFTVPFDIPGSTLFLPLISQPTAPLTTKSYALFGEASYELLDGKLIPLVGLRYFHDKRAASGTTIVFPTLTPPGITFTSSGSGKFKAWSPRFNLAYKPTNDQNYYINVAKGFRSGSVQTQAQVLFASIDGVTTSTLIEPDQLWTYEAGAKLRTPSRAITIDGAVYLTDWKDIQLPFTTSGGIVATLNGGDARLKGIELGLTWRTPVPNLTLQFVGNLNSAKFRNVDPALTARLPVATNGNRLPGVPKSTFTVAANYNRPVFADWDLSLHGSYSFRNRQSDLATGLLTPKLDQAVVRAGIENDHLRFQLFADNVLDEKGPVFITSTGVQALYPRRIGLNVGFKY
ncbi:TonB-dependent receptor [Sphingomonas arenae]|uniref:TonB-dependent receptor n=1 Tax=Sphingomonas arenae TaxID=2812555 RepID=UPI0019672DA4|nr:TonB-dependent receptor [Sphingomonas arenae]